MEDRPAKRWNRWHARLRLSVRGLMVLVLVLGVWFGLVVHRTRVQREAVAAIRRAGGQVSYDKKFLSDDEELGGPSWKKWLVVHLGIDYFENATEVAFYGASRGGVFTSGTPLGKDVNDAMMAEVGKLRGLLSLDLDGESQVTDAGLAHLRGLSRLQSLYLGPMKIQGPGLACLRGMSRLDHLNLGRLDLADADLVHLEGLTTLTYLSVSGRRITDAGLAPLAALTNLEWLRITGSPITSAGLVHLGGLRLMKLDLDDTRVESLEPLKGLTTLRSLSLNRTPINDVGLAPVAGFRNLEHLNGLAHSWDV